MTVLEASTLRLRRRRLRRARFSVLALVLLAAIPAGALAGRAALHRDEVMPGVRVLGSDVASVPATEVGMQIRTIVARRLAEPVPLAVGAERVEIAASKLFTLDRSATAAAALAAGRGSNDARLRSLLAPLADPIEVTPSLVVRPNAEKRLAALLARFAKPPVSARVVMRGTQPVVKPSRPGTQADVAALLAGVESRAISGEGVVRVTFAAAAPAVGDDVARAAADEVRLMVSAPISLTLRGEAVGSLAPGRLARLVTFVERDRRLIPLLDGKRLARVLDPVVAPHKTRAQNARFEVVGDRVRIVPSVQGTTLDPAKALVSVSTAAHASGNRVAPLALAPIGAEFSTAKAQALGIRQRISTFTTEMGPSSSNRIHNVHLMADYIDGTLIRPGETFSFNGSVGPRTPERGFLEGQMIVGSLLLPSIGGGVCQTATTLFNNAFELGLPIAERHNHSFYISHYPLGRDATVSWGGPDFRFVNDMKHGILIKASYTSSTLTFSFYGTDEGRRVAARTGERTNWREPTTSYALDPAAPRGSVRVERGSHQSGFDVTVYRTVTQGGKVVRNDAFTSHYIPVGDTHVYGPGRTIPGSYFVIPTT